MGKQVGCLLPTTSISSNNLKSAQIGVLYEVLDMQQRFHLPYCMGLKIFSSHQTDHDSMHESPFKGTGWG